jgi:hypothetical protein
VETWATVEQYNNYYGVIEPYIIEYPFSYKFQDEILQNVKIILKHISIYHMRGIYSEDTKIETNDQWFNKAILYNGQQSLDW